MHQRAFDYSYQAFTADGAQWLVDNTDIALIGIDYLSIAHHDDLSGPHDIILGAVRAALRLTLRVTAVEHCHGAGALQNGARLHTELGPVRIGAAQQCRSLWWCGTAAVPCQNA